MPPYGKVLTLLSRAQSELTQTDTSRRQSAIDDAYDAALLVQTKTADHALAAQIYDGFLLPALRFARTDPTFYDSRRQLLKAAFGAYQQAGQEDREIAVLTLLRGEASADENFQDWTNLQLSSLYAHRGQYAPAIKALEAVQTPGMMGSKTYRDEMRLKLDAQQAKQKPKPVKVKSVKKLIKKSTKRKTRH